MFAPATYAQQYELKLLKRFYSIGTAGINGTYYPLGGAIARTFNSDLSNLEVIAEPTKGSVANIEYLREKQIDLALVQSDVAFQAFTGTGQFDGSPFNELKILASLYPEVLHIVVRADSQINSIQDLVGKTVSMGTKESGSAITSIAILRSLGITPDKCKIVYERFTKGTESLKDGYVQALMYTGGVPANGIALLAEKCKIRLIPITKKEAAQVIKSLPYLSNEVILPNTYKYVDVGINALALRAMFVTTDTLSNNTVHNMLKVLFKHSNDISKLSKSGVKLSLKDALKSVSREMLHSGARKYYQEKLMLNAPSAPSPSGK